MEESDSEHLKIGCNVSVQRFLGGEGRRKHLIYCVYWFHCIEMSALKRWMGIDLTCAEWPLGGDWGSRGLSGKGPAM